MRDFTVIDLTSNAEPSQKKRGYRSTGRFGWKQNFGFIQFC